MIDDHVLVCENPQPQRAKRLEPLVSAVVVLVIAGGHEHAVTGAQPAQDFPGDALTCLVIAKLPFPRQDPLFQARRRACEESGERWFERFYLPEAVLKFRQGFGRLIRTESDTGVVVVLDHRLSQKMYRRDFLGSLPDLEVVEAAPADIPAVVEHHLRRLAAHMVDGA